MRATRGNGKGFQSEKEGEDKLGQTFCMKKSIKTLLVWMFFPWGLRGLEGNKPMTCWWGGEGGENEVSTGRRSHVICLVSSARNPWR